MLTSLFVSLSGEFASIMKQQKMKLEYDDFEKKVLLNAIEAEIDLLKKVRKKSIHQLEELTALYDLEKKINSETSHNSSKKDHYDKEMDKIKERGELARKCYDSFKKAILMAVLLKKLQNNTRRKYDGSSF